MGSTQIVLKLPPPAGAPAPRRWPCRAAPTAPTSATRRVRRLHLRPGDQQHRDHQLQRRHHPVPAAEHHRQHRLAGRPDVRVRGLRPGRPATPRPRPRRAAWPTPSRRPGRSSSPGTPPPTTSASPATTSTPTARCRTSVSGTVLTYTDSQPDSATVTYYVRANDAAGNQSANSNTVTRTGSGGPAPTWPWASRSPPPRRSFTFVADQRQRQRPHDVLGRRRRHLPATLTVQLGANADLSSIVVQLNPDRLWGPRPRPSRSLGREQSATGFTTLAAATPYTFNPATGNTVTIPVTARVADVQLKFTANTGAGGGQVAEFQVFGVPAPNPDLTVTGRLVDADRPGRDRRHHRQRHGQNAGTLARRPPRTSTSTWAPPRSAPRRSARWPPARRRTVSANIGTQDAGCYQLTAKVDEANRSSSRTRPTTPTPTRRRWSSPRCELRPGRGHRAGRRATRPRATP